MSPSTPWILIPRPNRIRSMTLPNAVGLGSAISRSEEHTSELQSRRDLVCRLLLEKKKKKQHQLNELEIQKQINSAPNVALFTIYLRLTFNELQSFHHRLHRRSNLNPITTLLTLR